MTLPSGIHALKMEGWNTAKIMDYSKVEAAGQLWTSLFGCSLSCDKDLKEGNYAISVEIRYDGKEYIQKVDFSISKRKHPLQEFLKKGKFTWYIQRIVAL
ncbi:MAG: hypothetical protein ACLUIQ_01075 [Dialister invisus]